MVRPLAGGAATQWNVFGASNDNVYFTANPVAGGSIAYMCSLCSGSSGILVGDQAGDPPTAVDNPGFAEPYVGWSPGGTELVDSLWTQAPGSGVYTAGIWGFSPTAAGAHHLILADPNPPTAQYQPGTFGQTAFAGPNEIVFADRADGNLWEVPANCNACSFPANAHQLTTDGTASAGDGSPVWTGQTIAGLRTPTPVLPPPPVVPPGKPVDEVSALKLASSKVRFGKRLTFEVTLKAPSKITIEILRHVPASGRGKHRKKAHYVVVGTLTFNGKAGLNKLLVSKLRGHKLAVGKYEAQVSAGGAKHVITFTIRR